MPLLFSSYILSILFPFLLVFLLGQDKGVAFLGLRKHQQIEWKAQPMAIWCITALPSDTLRFDLLFLHKGRS
ncbi:hypothetical protein F5Y08DRAFT_112546 [Xylaria arbuscula]|nr:hypothetical protein F5Y08DRAFT_112546 [Xylaria arbuscula]